MLEYPYYFAYGSNMNPARMLARGVDFVHHLPAWMDDYALFFNKRAHNKTGIAYANIGYSPGERLEGVLYQLESAEQLQLLDNYEGTPVRYSRDIFRLQTAKGHFAAWVYVANPAYIAAELLVEQRYMRHLLAAESLLSPHYVERLKQQQVLPAQDQEEETEHGLRYNG